MAQLEAIVHHGEEGRGLRCLTILCPQDTETIDEGNSKRPLKRDIVVGSQPTMTKKKKVCLVQM